MEPKTNKKRKVWQTHTTTATDQCKKIAETFSKISSNEDIKEMTEKEKNEFKETIDECEKHIRENPPPPVTERELKRALRKANKKSAKGHDGVTTLMVVSSCNNKATLDLLLKAINSSIIEGHEFPVELKRAKVTMEGEVDNTIDMLDVVARWSEDGKIETSVQEADEHEPISQFSIEPPQELQGWNH